MRPSLLAGILGGGAPDVSMAARFVMTSSDAGWLRTTRNGSQIATHSVSGGFDGVYNNSATGYTNSSRFVSVCELPPTSGTVLMSVGAYGSATSGGAVVLAPQVTMSMTGLTIRGSVEGASANTSTAYTDTNLNAIPSGAATAVWSQGSGYASLAAHLAATKKILSSRLTGGIAELCSSLDNGATWVQLAIYTPRYTLGGAAQLAAASLAYYQSLAASPSGSVIYGGWV